MARMIEVEVEFVTLLGKLYGKDRSVVYEKLDKGATLRSLLAILSSKYEPVRGMLDNRSQGTYREIVVLINGKYPYNGLSTRLNDKDKVTLLPLVGGG